MKCYNDVPVGDGRAGLGERVSKKGTLSVKRTRFIVLGRWEFGL